MLKIELNQFFDEYAVKTIKSEILRYILEDDADKFWDDLKESGRSILRYDGPSGEILSETDCQGWRGNWSLLCVVLIHFRGILGPKWWSTDSGLQNTQ